MDTEERNLNILLVEDNAYRMGLIKQELEISGTRCRLHTVGTGTETLKYLQREAPYSNVPQPDLILLDFSQPRSRYLKLIEKIKASETFNTIPFVILTRPESEQVLEDKYPADGNCVMFSPIELAAFLRTMNATGRNRFMNAIVLVGALGLVLVRTSRAFEEDQANAPVASYV